MVKKIVIFASGSGSNAENVAQYFLNNPLVKVQALFCNNPKAGVIAKMKRLNIPVHVFSRAEFSNQALFLETISPYQPDLIALLGFLWKVPSYLIKAYPDQIINLHPALLPKYGGKGMYGHFVHEAVKMNNEKETGITLHRVNENYDEGAILAQFKCNVLENDSVNDIAFKIHQLEQKHVPELIGQLLLEA